MYSFPVAAVANYHKLGSLKWIHPLTVLETESLKSRCQQGHAPSRGFRGESAPCLFQFLVSAGLPWLEATITPTSASIFALPSPLCVSWISLFLYYVKTLLAFTAHLYSPGLSPVSRSLIISVKMLFPNKKTFYSFWGLRPNVFGAPSHPLHLGINFNERGTRTLYWKLCYWEKSEKTQVAGQIVYAHGSEDLIL